MVQIIWMPQAQEDLQQIHTFISQDSKQHARKYLAKLRGRVDILIEFPQSGRVVPEQKDEAIRELIEGNYRIVYKIVSQKRIDILFIHHSKKALMF